MIRRAIALFILISVVIGPAHASIGSNQSEQVHIVNVTDDFGYTTTIDEFPQRIISLAPSNTEILFALGVGERVVGVTDYCNYPSQVGGIEAVGGYSTVNIEKVISLEPDLILASFGNTEEVITHLRDLGFNVVAFNPATISDVLDNILIAGAATGATPQAEALVGEYRDRIDAVTAHTQYLATRPSVVHVVWNDPIYVSGNATFQNEMIEIAGGFNAYPEIDGWEVVSLESFISKNPDIIIVNSGTGMGTGSETLLADYFRNEPRMQNVNAIKNERIYVIDADTVDRAGPRIINALELFAEYIHPEIFIKETGTGEPESTTIATETANTISPTPPTEAAASPYLVPFTIGAILVGFCAVVRRPKK